mgnify:CR=1 FL=1
MIYFKFGAWYICRASCEGLLLACPYIRLSNSIGLIFIYSSYEILIKSILSSLSVETISSKPVACEQALKDFSQRIPWVDWQYLTHGQETKAKALCFHWRLMPLLFNASANAHQYDDFSSKWQNMPYPNRDSTMSLEHLVNSFCAWKYERWISKVLFKAEVNMAQVKC